MTKGQMAMMEVRVAIQLAHFEAWEGHYAPRHLAQAKYLLHNEPMRPMTEKEIAELNSY